MPFSMAGTVQRWGWLLSGAFAVCCTQSAVAQLIQAPLNDGFVKTSSVSMSVEEMLGAQKPRAAGEMIVGPGYPSLFVCEVQYKPVRLLRVDVTDPSTGQPSRELVWYMLYRVIPRDYTELAGDRQEDLLAKLTDPEVRPRNRTDEVMAYPLQIPRFRLQETGPDGVPVAGAPVLLDQVNLQIRDRVFERELADRGSVSLLTSVAAIQEVAEPVSVYDEDPLANALYGVAIWRNVDPKIDYFQVEMAGFSNAYRLQPQADGAVQVEEKVIRQKFSRPGDEFEAAESEFTVSGDPEWIYVPTQFEVTAPRAVEVLRNPEAGVEDSAGS